MTDVFHYMPELEFTPVGSGQVTWVHPGGPLEDGAELLRYRVTRGAGQPKVKSHTKIGADIVVGQGSGPAEGMYVAKLLGWLRDYVEWIIDTLGYKHFGGREPKGLVKVTTYATRSVSVAEAPDLG